MIVARSSARPRAGAPRPRPGRPRRPSATELGRPRRRSICQTCAQFAAGRSRTPGDGVGVRVGLDDAGDRAGVGEDPGDLLGAGGLVDRDGDRAGRPRSRSRPGSTRSGSCSSARPGRRAATPAAIRPRASATTSSRNCAQVTSSPARRRPAVGRTNWTACPGRPRRCPRPDRSDWPSSPMVATGGPRTHAPGAPRARTGRAGSSCYGRRLTKSTRSTAASRHGRWASARPAVGPSRAGAAREMAITRVACGHGGHLHPVDRHRAPRRTGSPRSSATSRATPSGSPRRSRRGRRGVRGRVREPGALRHRRRGAGRRVHPGLRVRRDISRIEWHLVAPSKMQKAQNGSYDITTTATAPPP